MHKREKINSHLNEVSVSWWQGPYLLKSGTSQNNPKPAKTSRNKPKQYKTSQNDSWKWNNRKDTKFQNWTNLEFSFWSFRCSNIEPKYPNLGILDRKLSNFNEISRVSYFEGDNFKLDIGFWKIKPQIPSASILGQEVSTF